MVYNGNSSGLNDTLWTPNFDLPMVRYMSREIEEGTYMKAQEVGGMFLNFMLSKEVRS